MFAEWMKPHTQKAMYFMLPLYDLSRVNKSTYRKRLVVARGQREGGVESDALMDLGLPLGVIKIFSN